MDVTKDTKNHIDLVCILLSHCANELQQRGTQHDESKLRSPEKEMYEEWRPKLDSMSIESAEYKDALAKMGEGLKHHYAANRHHPEHFVNGLNGMNLIDVMEMICDWVAAAARKGEKVNMKWACERFGIDEHERLYHIIQNTLEWYVTAMSKPMPNRKTPQEGPGIFRD